LTRVTVLASQALYSLESTVFKKTRAAVYRIAPHTLGFVPVMSSACQLANWYCSCYVLIVIVTSQRGQRGVMWFKVDNKRWSVGQLGIEATKSIATPKPSA